MLIDPDLQTTGLWKDSEDRRVCKMAVRWGICSAGKISHDFVVGLKSDGDRSKQHEVAAVAARSYESAEKFAKTHSIPKIYGSYKQLAEDPDVSLVAEAHIPS